WLRPAPALNRRPCDRPVWSTETFPTRVCRCAAARPAPRPDRLPDSRHAVSHVGSELNAQLVFEAFAKPRSDSRQQRTQVARKLPQFFPHFAQGTLRRFLVHSFRQAL